LGCAPMAHALWGRVMRFSPEDPKWMNRDRFILSNGHACALQYSMLHLTGYDLTLADLESFRRIGSRCPGHPENFMTPGVEVCTGPLGQGFADSVGLALAGAHMAARYNRPSFPLFDSAVFVICGDGCLMEGITSEAAALATILAVPRLTVLYDDNKITIDGSTDLAFTEDVGDRFKAYGWDVSVIENGDTDITAVVAAVEGGRSRNKPALVKVQTTIGFGSVKANTSHVHGAPLAAEDLQQMRRSIGLPEDKAFNVPKRISDFYGGRGIEGNLARKAWIDLLERYGKAHPSEHEELTRRVRGDLPNSWKESVVAAAEKGSVDSGDAMLCALAANIPELVGGSMASAPTFGTTEYPAPPALTADAKDGQHIEFGAGLEHAVGAFCLALSAFGGFRSYWRCPVVELPNAWGAVRLTALGKFPVLHVATHSGVDTSEVLTLCRATPNLAVFRPADAREVAAAYIAAIESESRPTVVVLPPPGTNLMDGSSIEAAKRGGYVIADFPENAPACGVMVATGIEVGPCLQVREILAKGGIGIRVVSLTSWEVFDEQPEEYQHTTLKKQRMKLVNKAAPSNPVPIIYAEAHATLGFERYATHFVDTSAELKVVTARVHEIVADVLRA